MHKNVAALQPFGFVHDAQNNFSVIRVGRSNSEQV